MAPKIGILALAARYYRPHAWAYGIAMLLGSLLALLGAVSSWLFWPLMIWTLLFLAHFLVAKSLEVDSGWVAARTKKTAMKAFDISHIETIREGYDKSPARYESKDGDEGRS